MLDVTISGAIIAGLLTFLSPCILPIVPFYLSYMAGVSMGELRAEGGLAPGARRRAVLSAIMFSLGIVTVFVLLGAAAFALSQTFRAYATEFRWVAAGIVFLIGIHFLGLVRIPFLNRTFQMEGGDTQNMTVLGSYIVGFAFAAGWTPCVGGVLTGVIMTASMEATAMEGLGLLLVFGFSMTAPFVIAAIFIGPFLTFVNRFRRYLPWVEKAMGVLMLVFAALIATNSVNAIAQWLLSTFPVFMEIL